MRAHKALTDFKDLRTLIHRDIERYNPWSQDQYIEIIDTNFGVYTKEYRERAEQEERESQSNW
jgi:hypothetical protein